MKKIIYLIVFVSQLWIGSAAFAFVVKKIEFQGLQRATPETVMSYLPVKRGQVLRPAKTAELLRALYKTGFFEHITLSQEGNTLIIHVVERPTIGQLKITGNSVIPTDKLTTVMKSLEVTEGSVYNPSVLEKIRQSLLNQYYQLGRYNARVDIQTSPLPRNRLLVNVRISEGLVTKIRHISIIGNKVFDENTLVKQLDITDTGLFTFFTQTDRYSEEKMESSLEKLRSYYLDHGYLHVDIKSAQAEMSPDRKSVYVTIVVNEGELYTVSGYEIDGYLPVPREEIIKQIHIKAGEPFSRQKVLDAEKAITSALGTKGYLFATVTIQPQGNERTRTVFLRFVVTTGKRAYVRHITFSDNTRTNDVVLRREIEQMEAAPASSTSLDDSKRHLTLLPYIKEAEMSVKPVPDVDDQVDVNYKIKEDNSAQASLKVGYSQAYRLILGAGLNQKNFLGTGNTLGINFQRSKYEQLYSIDYTDPYYTPEGISRTFDFSISRINPAGAGINVGYTTHEYDLGVLYGIPIGQERNAFNRLHVGAGIQDTFINLVPNYLSNQVNSFVTRHGTHMRELDMKLGYSRDSRDRAIFPTAGTLQTLFLNAYAPLSQNSVSFYTLDYSGKWYRPLNDQFIILSKANLGYGNAVNGARNFPFYKNYFLGGIDSLRGYETFSLGPRDSAGNPFGANMLIDGSVGLIFPNYISDNLRTTAFVDAGNVYSSFSNRSYGGQSTDTGPIRYSVGIEADMMTPFGPVELSLATRLNKEPHDQVHAFQFAMGANF